MSPRSATYCSSRVDTARPAVLVAFVDERVGDRHGGDGVELGLRDGLRVVVVGDGFDDAVRQPPQPQQLAPDLGVGHPALLLLDLEQRAVLARARSSTMAR